VRLGIFGGTFDPPHVGHLLAASDAIEHLGLDRLIFVPAAVQPLKVARDTAPGGDRLAMVRLTAGRDERLATDSVELDREGLSYTVDTLREFGRRYPSAERYFLVGADVLASFAQWREPQTVLELATLAVLTRRADGADGVEAQHEAADRRGSAVTNALDEALARRSTLVPTRRIDVSSTEIRDRVRAGRSIHGFVTDAVAEYIGSHALYR
jgi:nicotinate-nucleotide adenylyltransferase